MEEDANYAWKKKTLLKAGYILAYSSEEGMVDVRPRKHNAGFGYPTDDSGPEPFARISMQDGHITDASGDNEKKTREMRKVSDMLGIGGIDGKLNTAEMAVRQEGYEKHLRFLATQNRR